ncbi:MAG: SDR family oxidoreductase [Nitrospirae bacterium]|nr:SDR family oxidoreductase [Nitrospirota bacterium]
MSGKFNNKVILITGGARGIGKKIAKKFTEEGSNVIICDIDKDQSEKTKLEFDKEGLRVNFICMDLSNKGAPQGMIRQIIKDFGKLDVLVNNARSGERVGFWEETDDTWDKGIAVTLKAAFFASQEAIRAMSQNREGSIVNIGSIASSLVCHESPVYHAAKAGLMHLTRYLAVHGGTYGVRVNAVLPGFIVQDEHVERYERADNEEYRKTAEFCHPIRKVGCSDDIAEAVLFLCSTAASFITGQCIIVDGGLTIQDPSSLLSSFDKKMC